MNLNLQPTHVYQSTHRPPVETHVYCILDDLVGFLLSTESPERTLPILTNHYCMSLKNGPYILYNTEQLTRPRVLEAVVQRAYQADIQEVWDYSQTNVEALRRFGIQARHVPVKTQPQRVAELQQLYKSQPKEYDVGFCGVLPPRRQTILQELSTRGVKVLAMATVYGSQRDELLAKCKIQLNIHQTEDHKIFESVRCDPWLSAGQPIVSEESLDSDNRCITVPYEKLVDVTIQLLSTIHT